MRKSRLTPKTVALSPVLRLRLAAVGLPRRGDGMRNSPTGTGFAKLSIGGEESFSPKYVSQSSPIRSRENAVQPCGFAKF
jgi:hypothetical protein